MHNPPSESREQLREYIRTKLGIEPEQDEVEEICNNGELYRYGIGLGSMGHMTKTFLRANHAIMTRVLSQLRHFDYSVCISLTTTPQRLCECIKMLTRLSNTAKINGCKGIILNLPKYFRNCKDTGSYDVTCVPASINGIPVILHRLDEDLGPITKMLGAFLYLSKTGQACDIVYSIDDDQLFSANQINLLSNICYVFNYVYGIRMAIGGHGQPVSFWDKKHEYSSVWKKLRPNSKYIDGLLPHVFKEIDVIEGFGSIAYPFKFVKGLVNDLLYVNQLSKDLRMSDDLTISYVLNFHRFFRIKFGLYHTPVIASLPHGFTSTDRLHAITHHDSDETLGGDPMMHRYISCLKTLHCHFESIKQASRTYHSKLYLSLPKTLEEIQQTSKLIEMKNMKHRVLTCLTRRQTPITDIYLSMAILPTRKQHLSRIFVFFERCAEALSSLYKKPVQILLHLPKYIDRLHCGWTLQDVSSITSGIKTQHIHYDIVDDFGPITKLHYALEYCKYNNTSLIVTVDDDIVYPTHAFDRIIASGILYEKYAFANKGIIRTENALRFTNKDKLNVDIVEGYGGVCYDSSMFVKKTWKNFISYILQRNELKFSDDVTISYYLQMNGYQCITSSCLFLNDNTFGWFIRACYGEPTEDSLYAMNNDGHVSKYFKCLKLLDNYRDSTK